MAISNTFLQSFVKNLTEAPGIYRFYSKDKELLYVGKARNLKKRVTSYLRDTSSLRIHALVSQITHAEITVTLTEHEALLLESNVIKAHKPHYNILLRDDKSYPYLVLSKHPSYPRLSLYRGKPKSNANYFGPYPSVAAVKETLNFLQKLFLIRSCNDTFFKSRLRPCLLHQIKRCSAPCVNFITSEAYQTNVNRIRLFLEGRNAEIIKELKQQMKLASRQQNYELAARIRDQLHYLEQVRRQQAMVTSHLGDTDVMVWHQTQGTHCIYILPVRQGEVLSGQAYFPQVPELAEKQEILSSFITQFYLNNLQSPPQQILVDNAIEDQTWLSSTLSQHYQKKIMIRHQGFNKHQTQWLKMAVQNAYQSLENEIQTQQHKNNQRMRLQKALKLHTAVERIECFDISHTQGESAVASCVVFDAKGACKKEYRRFNLVNIVPGDDYAALKQAIERRYTHQIKENAPLPHLLMIDGGKGQLTQAIDVLKKLNIIHQIPILGIAKGPARKPGEETLFFNQNKIPIVLEPQDPALHLLQQIRDEAHRFAITGHRKKRAKRIQQTTLENIPGIGPSRRRQLLSHFSGLNNLKQATVEDLEKLSGISKVLAQKIYLAVKTSI